MRPAGVDALRLIRELLHRVHYSPRHAAPAVVHGWHARRALQSIRAASLRENPQSIAVTVHDAASYAHLLFEFGIPRRELVRSVRRFDQEQALTFGGIQALEDFLGKDHAE
jgi:hypothetical protein